MYRMGTALYSASDTQAWLDARGLNLDDIEEFVETNLLIGALRDWLEERADKSKYLSAIEVKSVLRNLIYADWLSEQY